jgi:hypothetical protein
MMDAIQTKSAILTQPKAGYYFICIQQEDGEFKRFQISKNDVMEILFKGADIAFRQREGT